MTRQRRHSAERGFDYHEANAKLRLSRPGCPVCADTIEGLEGQKNWLLAAGYSTEGIQNEFSQSGGYCLGHAHWLAEAEMPHALTRLYRELTATTLERLGAASLRGPTREPFHVPCPFCAFQRASERRYAAFFARAWGSSEIRARYGHPGFLCVRHLHMTLEDLDHKSAGDLRAKQLMLWSTVGRSRSSSAIFEVLLGEGRLGFPRPLLRRAKQSGEGPRSISEALDEAMSWDDVCPICAVMIEMQSPVPARGLGALCPYHVHKVAFAGGRGPRHLLSREANSLAEWKKAVPKSLRERVIAVMRPDHPSEPPGACVECEAELALATTTARAVLHDVGEESHRWHLMGGYGLCVTHAVLAMQVANSEELRRLLATSLRSVLLPLLERLENYLRKMAWVARFEPKGNEQTAWKDAISRFAGQV